MSVNRISCFFKKQIKETKKFFLSNHFKYFLKNTKILISSNKQQIKQVQIINLS